MNVVWLSFHADAPTHGYWCYGWLEEILDRPEHQQFYKVEDVPENEGAIVVIPAEYNVPHVGAINRAISELPWCTLILASDEQGLFPVERLRPVTNLFVMTPHFDKHTYPRHTQFLGEFYPQAARGHVRESGHSADRQYDVSFTGQITHARRREMVQACENLPRCYMGQTAGFTQGLPHNLYYELLTQSKVVPAPSGPATIDSFRAYEALEAGCVPILDNKLPDKPDYDGRRYWSAVLGDDHPLPSVDNWKKAPGIVRDIANAWPDENNFIYSWWQMYKREKRSAIVPTISDITVLIPSSPIPSHPSLAIIEETVRSIRHWHPVADIIIMCDGIRPEQQHYHDRYQQYLSDLLWKCNFEWTNVFPLVFSEHQHQANMTRAALDHVTTPLVLFVEHDTPLVTDEPIDWDGIITLGKSDDIDMIRFHFEAQVHPEHEYMSIDKEPILLHGVPVRRTVQWSQRPHVAKADYYRRILREHFPPSGRTMIEDKMHSVAQEFPDRNRIAIYHPAGNIKRSLHTDGREHDEKFPMVYE